MPGNYHAGGSGDDIVVFDKPVGHLNINVATGVTFSISLDGGENYMGLPAGFHNLHISPVFEVRILASGDWQLIGARS